MKPLKVLKSNWKEASNWITIKIHGAIKANVF